MVHDTHLPNSVIVAELDAIISDLTNGLGAVDQDEADHLLLAAWRRALELRGSFHEYEE